MAVVFPNVRHFLCDRGHWADLDPVSQSALLTT
jgi:hypothetical protein